MAGSPQGGTGIGNVNQAAAQAVLNAGLSSGQDMFYAPSQVQAGQLATTDYAPYMNPYTQNVIDAQAADVLRNAQIGIGNLGAQAQAAKAFGGSRHGIAEAEIGRGVTDILGQQSAALRGQAFQNAQAAAQQDIANRLAADQFNVQSGLSGQQARLAAAGQLADIGQTGFNMGQTVQQNLYAQGALQQAVQQALIDEAKQQYAGYVGAPANTINYLSNAIGAVPQGGGGTTTQTGTSDGGLFGALSSIGGFVGALGNAGLLSDERLKDDITFLKRLPNGIEIFKWKWNDIAKKIGANENHTVGVIAQKVMKSNPDAVSKHHSGYFMVNYSKLGISV